jgi:hypothetical protein
MIFITGDATCIATLNLKRPYLSCRFAKEKKDWPRLKSAARRRRV